MTYVSGDGLFVDKVDVFVELLSNASDLLFRQDAVVRDGHGALGSALSDAGHGSAEVEGTVGGVSFFGVFFDVVEASDVLGEHDFLELVQKGLNSDFAAIVQFLNGVLLDLSPVPALAVIVLLETFVELSEQVRVHGGSKDLSELLNYIIKGISLTVVQEIVDVINVHAETILQYVLHVAIEVLNSLHVSVSHFSGE